MVGRSRKGGKPSTEELPNNLHGVDEVDEDPRMNTVLAVVYVCRNSRNTSIFNNNPHTQSKFDNFPRIGTSKYL